MGKQSNTLFFLLIAALLCSYACSSPFPSPEAEDGIEEPCLVVNGLDVLDEMFVSSFASVATLFRCATRVGPVITFLAGNTSLDSFETVCADTPLFSFNEEESITDMTAFGLPFVCMADFCSFYAIMGQDVLLSAAVRPSEVEMVAASAESEVPFLTTTVLYDLEEGMGEEFATAIVGGFISGVTDPIVLRALTFLGSTETTCVFPEE